MNKFWMVYRVPGHQDSCFREPTKEHPTYASANTEANRLAKKHPGSIFIVLEAVSSSQCSVGPVKVELCTVSQLAPTPMTPMSAGPYDPKTPSQEP